MTTKFKVGTIVRAAFRGNVGCTNGHNITVQEGTLACVVETVPGGHNGRGVLIRDFGGHEHRWSSCEGHWEEVCDG